MRSATDNADYDAADNGAKCYNLAIRSIRLEKIRAGELTPRQDDPEEMEAARELTRIRQHELASSLD